MYSVVAHVKKNYIRRRNTVLRKIISESTKPYVLLKETSAEAEWKEVNEFSLHGAFMTLSK